MTVSAYWLKGASPSSCCWLLLPPSLAEQGTQHLLWGACLWWILISLHKHPLHCCFCGLWACIQSAKTVPLVDPWSKGFIELTVICEYSVDPGLTVPHTCFPSTQFAHWWPCPPVSFPVNWEDSGLAAGGGEDEEELSMVVLNGFWTFYVTDFLSANNYKLYKSWLLIFKILSDLFIIRYSCNYMTFDEMWFKKRELTSFGVRRLF